MRIPATAALTLSLLMTFGCKDEGESQLIPLSAAKLEVSSSFVEFGSFDAGDGIRKTVTLSNSGDLDLGIKCVMLGTDENPSRGFPGTFEISYNLDNMIDPNNSSGSSDTGADEEARAVPQDTGFETDTEEPGETDTEDPGEQTTEGCADDGDLLFTLPGGARLPLTVKYTAGEAGYNYDALRIVTDTVEYGEDSDVGIRDKVYADLVNEWTQVYLEGYSVEADGQLSVEPLTVDFGFAWEGDENTRYVTLTNTGDGDVTLSSVYLQEEDCDESFSVAVDDEGEEVKPEDGTVLAGAAKTVLGLTFAPEDDKRAQCKATIETSDGSAFEVTMYGNNGENPANEAPTIKILDPEAGYQHNGWGALEMELVVTDANQPPDTLFCSVKSMYQLEGAALASCTPDNESGHITVDVPTEYLDNGIDLFKVVVVDASEITRCATIPVLINESYPDDDDDGDGFTVDDPDYPDCDDSDPNTYQNACELEDGIDNDCDTLIDEDTNGFDDDGDGQSEDDGDCNDNDATIYQGGPENADYADNDCDGTIDEGTNLYDDDGDGFSDLDGDVDDSDPLVYPGQTEICSDDKDNDCDYKVDESDCVSDSNPPVLIGEVNLSQTGIEEGESVSASVLVYDPDEDDELTYSWDFSSSAPGNAGSFSDTTGSSVEFTATDLSELEGNYEDFGNRVKLFVEITDSDENNVWDFENLIVWPSKSLYEDIVVYETVTTEE